MRQHWRNVEGQKIWRQRKRRTRLLNEAGERNREKGRKKEIERERNETRKNRERKRRERGEIRKEW
jgi:hypothetical protein